MSELLIPEPVLLDLRGSLSEHGREKANWVVKKNSWSENDLRRMDGLDLVESGDGAILPIIGGGSVSFSDYLELKLLDHIFNDASFSAPSPFLGLWPATTTLTDASTGAATNEAGYTGYARLAIATSDMSAAAAGAKTNSAVLTFAACTASSSTITQFMIADNGTTGAGNSLVWGTVTSVTIDTSHTPATVAASGLSVTLD